METTYHTINEELAKSLDMALNTLYWHLDNLHLPIERIDNPNAQEEMRKYGSYSPTIRVITEDTLNKLKGGVSAKQDERDRAQQQQRERDQRAREARQAQQQVGETRRNMERATRACRNNIRMLLADYDHRDPEQKVSMKMVEDGFTQWKRSVDAMREFNQKHPE